MKLYSHSYTDRDNVFPLPVAKICFFTSYSVFYFLFYLDVGSNQLDIISPA